MNLGTWALWFKLWFSVGLLSLQLACSETPQLNPLPSDAVVLSYGDSLTFGTGGGENGSYPQQLERQIKRRVVNAGVPGENSQEGFERLAGVLARQRPQLVTLCHGGNDLLRRMDSLALRRNLRKMIELALQSGAQVLLVGVPKPGLLIDPPALYAELAEDFGLPYQGEILTSLLTDPALKSDAVHLNSVGYRQLAVSLSALLVEAGALEP